MGTVNYYLRMFVSIYTEITSETLMCAVRSVRFLNTSRTCIVDGFAMDSTAKSREDTETLGQSPSREMHHVTTLLLGWFDLRVTRIQVFSSLGRRVVRTGGGARGGRIKDVRR